MNDARLFLALWPGDAVRAELAKWRDGWRWPSGATPVPNELLHLTLHFIGALDAAKVPALADALDMPFAPFELRFGRAALWPHGVAVLEPEATPMALARLQAGLGEALAAEGLPQEERPFRPHVTMARRAANAAPPQDGPPVCWRVGGYVLMQSVPGKGYEIVRRYA